MNGPKPQRPPEEQIELSSAAELRRRLSKTVTILVLLTFWSSAADANGDDHKHRFRSFAPSPGADPVAGVSTPELRVRIAQDLASLRDRIERLPQVKIARDYTYDLVIERQNDGLIALYHANGDLIGAGFDSSSALLLERIGRLAQVKALVDLTYPHQRFDLSLELSTDDDLLTRDQRFEITARTHRPASLLLLNIDKTGTVSVLYPSHERELQRIQELEETFEVVPPYGTEYLKLFAFYQPPEGLERWIGRQIESLQDLDRLLQMLRSPGVDSAQTRLKVVTIGEQARDE